jgi:predicted nucleic acid-binding protein
VAGLVDTNILVYRYDPRDPEKQEVARAFLRDGVARQSLRLPHQAIVEFVSVVTKPIGGGPPLLPREYALEEAEELLSEFTILYPNPEILVTACRGAAMYRMPWFDAHLWAYAEHYGLPTLFSEDFQSGRIYGQVRIVNPFIVNA